METHKARVLSFCQFGSDQTCRIGSDYDRQIRLNEVDEAIVQI